MGIRGERELRGERHGKGGRSLATAVASSFFILLSGFVQPAASQWTFEVRAGVAGSSTLVEDRVATPRVAQALAGAFTGSARAVPSPGPAVGFAARTAIGARTTAGVTADWTFTTVQATDGAGTRDLQNAGVAHAALEVRFAPAARVFGAVAFGGIRYFTEEAGAFAGGTDLSPLLQASAGARVWRGLALTTTGQIHRFGTPTIRTLGGQEGSVFRWLVQAGWTVERRR